ncbi:hypothetical protein BU14_0610s0005 [Porphyra umbilicalis]|uniref:Uncharacterized protein n=1 Tax=Porphyra umbilicalis TaxID=2786 RepID=A0A1X6NQZ6_PORUM|nr:hypothetical protein BU14_0610s0005 [Porphyra umbilicalis]|eukprot:OSX71049.1 hypothetical protein BU14_0610s0005 [Porphyra umbilicalis]
MVGAANPKGHCPSWSYTSQSYLDRHPHTPSVLIRGYSMRGATHPRGLQKKGRGCPTEERLPPRSQPAPPVPPLRRLGEGGGKDLGRARGV